MSASQGQEFNVRGYMVLNAASYLRETMGERESKAVFDSFPGDVRAAIDRAKPADWVPVSVFSHITRAIASISKGDEAKAQELLVTCGLFMAEEASNTFLKILLRMITPGLFIKKIPDIWSRDCSRGKLVVEELTNQRLLCRTVDMDGFDHVACTAAGFVTFVLKTMGKSIQKTTIQGWALDKPCVSGTTFEIIWSN
jgi:hypothetical protein